MDAKSKQKPSIWWDSLFFPQNFKMTVDRSPQECASRLASLEQVQIGFSSSSSLQVRIDATDDTTYDFEIRLNRFGRALRFASLKCKGVVFTDSWSGKTVIKGRFTLGILLLAFGVAALMIFFSSIAPISLEYWIGLIISCSAVGLQSQWDRRTLRELIYDVIMNS